MCHPVWRVALSGPSQHSLVGVVSTFSYLPINTCQYVSHHILSPIWHMALWGHSQHFLVRVSQHLFLSFYTDMKVRVTGHRVTSLACGSLGTVTTFHGWSCLNMFLSVLYRHERTCHMTFCQQSGTWLSRGIHNILWSGLSQHFFLFFYTDMNVYVTCVTSLARGSLGTVTTFSGQGCLHIFLTFLYRHESMRHMTICHQLARGSLKAVTTFSGQVVSTIYRRESRCHT